MGPHAIPNKMLVPQSITAMQSVQDCKKLRRYRFNEFTHSNYICMIDSVDFEVVDHPQSSIKELDDHIRNCHVNRK